MRVIGTAGHVDHGKSTLVKVLTGIDPDRLKEEKTRQMTIDLGFAWFSDPSGEEIGIVDVPGHRDFIENMLSGISAIDAVLLVIAADEGPMPQTKEHLAVIDLLKINEGLIVLTKVDLVQDDAWLELVHQDVVALLKGTTLEGKKIIPVSAITGFGMETLKSSIVEMVREIPQSDSTGTPRLPVDRVFSMAGFGTIVTGTLGGGQLRVGDQVEISPPGIGARIRGIQVYRKPVQTAQAGSRAAVNLVGIEQRAIERGSVIHLPKKYDLTSRIDANVEIIKDIDFDLKNNDLVKLFIATAERQARARILGKGRIRPGESGYVQFELDEQVIAAEKDRFILRRFSPANTIGGGVVLSAHPLRRYRLNDLQVIEQLDRRLNPTRENQLLSLIGDYPFISAGELETKAGMTAENIDFVLDSLIQSGKVILLMPDRYVSELYWTSLVGKARKKVELFHQSFPLLIGISAESLGKSLGIEKQLQSAVFEKLMQLDSLEMQNNRVKLPNREIRFSPGQQSRINEYMNLMKSNPFNPPSVKVSREILGDDVFDSLIDQDLLTQVSTEVVLTAQVYQAMTLYVVDECTRKGNLSVVEFRDHFATNRKISLALLEHLDSKGMTMRDGDARILKNQER
jgi:selenocysteine-specific elongation factor